MYSFFLMLDFDGWYNLVKKKMLLLEDLELYKVAKEFRKEVIKVANEFPKEEKFLLKSQIKNSVRSVTANIAEGYGRYYFKETIQYCRQSRGSLMETYDHLSSALDENYITQECFDLLKRMYEKLLKLLNGYIAYLVKRKSGLVD